MASVTLLRTTLWALVLYLCLSAVYIRLNEDFLHTSQPLPEALGGLVVAGVSLLLAVGLVKLSEAIMELTAQR